MIWRKLITHNYKAKLSMFILAILLWLFVMLRKEYEQELAVPIRVVRLKDNKILTETPPSSAEIVFRGRGTTLILFSLFGKAHIDLNLEKVHRYQMFPIRSDMIKWAPGIDLDVIEIVYPDTVGIHLDDIAEKKLPVKPLLTLSFDDNYMMIGPLVSDPDSVKVRGPQSIIENLTYIHTQARSLDHVNGNISTKLDLLPPNNQVQVAPNSVRITASVEKVFSRQFNEIPVQIIHSPPGNPGFAEPEEVNVTIQGTKEAVDSITPSDLQITVDARNDPRQDGRFKLQVSLPDNVDLIEVSPDEVTIIFRSLSDSSSP